MFIESVNGFVAKWRMTSRNVWDRLRGNTGGQYACQS